MESIELRKFNAVILCFVLVSSFQAVTRGTNLIRSTIAVETPRFSGEVSHGFIEGPYSVDLWYAWLNTSGTHLLFLAMHSAIYPSPINYFVGQHYFTADGTEVFIGNRLLGFEIYEDVNKNSVLDADFTDGFSNASDETRYFFMLNASQTVDLTPPSKNAVDNETHYTWKIKHRQAQGNIVKIGNTTAYIGGPETSEWEMLPSYFTGGWVSILDSLGFSFDYWVENDAAYLKIGLEFGTFSVEPWRPEEIVPVSFKNQCLATLYTTSVLSVEPYEVIIENQQGPRESTMKTNSTSLDIERKEAFKMVFGQKYALNGDSPQYESTAGVYPINSLPADTAYHARYFTIDTENIFREHLAQTSPNLSSNVTFSISKSSLIYRVCYPEWSNRTLSHDPLYIAYIGEPRFSGPQMPLLDYWLIVALAASTTILVVAIYRHAKIRRYKLNNAIRNVTKCTSRLDVL